MTEIDDTLVLDTSEMSDVRGIGWIDRGQLVTYHVTDKPEDLRRALSRPTIRLMAAYGKAGETSELGSGLYVSGNPDYWMNRSTSKWDFLKRVTKDDVKMLVAYLFAQVDKDKAHGRLSTGEYERAVRDLGYVLDGALDPDVLTMFAGQPYGYRFWQEDVLAGLGIKGAKKPHVLEIRIAGKLAELRRGNDPALFRKLRKIGVVGAYTRMGMGSNAELVLWDARAVKSVKETDD